MPRERAVAIGAFDGVHLGHRAVLRLVHDLARARSLTSTVLTFDRHPAEVVRPESAPKLLTTLDQKLLLKWPNLYYSTSAFAPRYYPKVIVDYANTRGADKVLYAGYYPMGRLPMRHGLLIPPMYGMPGGLLGETTIAQLLSDAGYVTQAVGKDSQRSTCSSGTCCSS